MLTLALCLMQFSYIRPPSYINHSNPNTTKASDSALRSQDTTTNYSVEESGALSRRTSTMLEKGIEVHHRPMKIGQCTSWLCPAYNKQKRPWTRLVLTDDVVCVLKGVGCCLDCIATVSIHSGYMSCCPVGLPQNQLPQSLGHRPFETRLRPVPSITVSPAHQNFTIKGRTDVLGSFSKPWKTRYNIFLKRKTEKRAWNGVAFTWLTARISKIYARAVVLNKCIMEHFKKAYVPSPTANQYGVGTVYSIAPVSQYE